MQNRNKFSLKNDIKFLKGSARGNFFSKKFPLAFLLFYSQYPINSTSDTIIGAPSVRARVRR